MKLTPHERIDIYVSVLTRIQRVEDLILIGNKNNENNDNYTQELARLIALKLKFRAFN